MKRSRLPNGTVLIRRVNPMLLKVMRPLPDGRWVVKLECPDGVVRTFRTGKPVSEARRESPSPRERFAILNRDGFRCRYCGRVATETELHIDHVIPLADGGTHDPENLATACKDCNLGKATTRLAPTG